MRCQMTVMLSRNAQKNFQSSQQKTATKRRNRTAENTKAMNPPPSAGSIYSSTISDGMQLITNMRFTVSGGTKLVYHVMRCVV